jgi:3-oxoacyl-[acyl-carrier-protein] synthase-1
MPALAITASGMVTAVGFNAPASLAALRAGIRNVNETNLWDPESGTYLPAGKVPLPHWWVGVGKLAELAAPAIHECLTAAQPVRPSQIPVLLGVAPPDRPCRLPNLDAQILGELADRLSFQLHPASRVIPRDHVSIAVALREAGELIAGKQAPCVVIAAVDSLVQQDLKNYYLSRRRLLTPAHSNGFSLGEAGGAVLVSPVGAGPGTTLQVLGIGLAREDATIESDRPLRAVGLTMAIREALAQAGLTIQEVQYRITDMNGEHYKFKEMTLSMMRFERKPKPKLFDLWHPIEYLGDVGAAIGPIVLGVALHAGQKGYGIGPTTICTFGNDDGERAAIILDYRSGEAADEP